MYTAVFDDIEMNYTVFGTGKKNMVILPGLSVKSVLINEDMISSAYGIFKTDYTVYLFDRRTNIPDNYGIDQIADDTVKIINKLGLKDIYLFGASQGGMIAMYMAINYPEIIKCMVLGSTASRLNDFSLKVISNWIYLAKSCDKEKMLSDMFTKIYAEKTIKNIMDYLIKSNIPDEEELSRFITLASSTENFDVYNLLDRIKCPVFVIGSNNDRVIGGASSIEISEKIGCKLFMYGDDYGHGVYDEASDYKEKMKSFFDSI